MARGDQHLCTLPEPLRWFDDHRGRAFAKQLGNSMLNASIWISGLPPISGPRDVPEHLHIHDDSLGTKTAEKFSRHLFTELIGGGLIEARIRPHERDHAIATDLGSIARIEGRDRLRADEGEEYAFAFIEKRNCLSLAVRIQEVFRIAVE